MSPPRKVEAIQQLGVFWRATCKGAQAVRYSYECAMSQEIVRRLGGQPP